MRILSKFAMNANTYQIQTEASYAYCVMIRGKDLKFKNIRKTALNFNVAQRAAVRSVLSRLFSETKSKYPLTFIEKAELQVTILTVVFRSFMYTTLAHSLDT